MAVKDLGLQSHGCLNPEPLEPQLQTPKAEKLKSLNISLSFPRFFIAPSKRQRRCRNLCSSPMDVPEDGPWPLGRDTKGSWLLPG